MDTYEAATAAGRAGITPGELARLVELDIVSPGVDGRFTRGALRRVGMVRSLVAAGIPLEGLGAAIRSGQFSLDFLDEPAYERFSALSGATFSEVAERTGVPVGLLMLIREAAGSAAPVPDDLVRDEELPYTEFIKAQVKAGFRPAAIERYLRVKGDSLRRITETETDWWNSEVIAPAMAAGKRPDEILGVDFANRMSMLAEQALMGMYHLAQMQAWTTTIIEGLAGPAGRRGPPHAARASTGDVLPRHHRLHAPHPGAGGRGGGRPGRAARPAGAATAVKHGGRPVKWLGDGVMLFFPDPGPGRSGRARDGGWASRRPGCRRPTSACTPAR